MTTATGTAFVCNSKKGPVLVTNWHNAAGRNPQTKQPLSPTGAIPDTVRIVHNRANALGQWVVKTESLVAGGKPRWVEHPSLGEKADIVAIPLTDLADVQLHPYVLYPGGARARRRGEGAEVPGTHVLSAGPVSRLRSSRGYRRVPGDAAFAPRGDAGFSRAVAAFVIEKAAYEVVYEASHRPEWIGIPVDGLKLAVTRLTA